VKATRGAGATKTCDVKTYRKQTSSRSSQNDIKSPFFNKSAQVRDTQTGGIMSRHLTSAKDVENLGKETARPDRTTNFFFGGKDTFFK